MGPISGKKTPPNSQEINETEIGRTIQQNDVTDHVPETKDRNDLTREQTDETVHQDDKNKFLEVEGYEILHELGRGGMGVVYMARQIKLNRNVALKMVLSGAHASSKVRDRFMREAEASAKLQHPNIVRVYDMGESNGQPFFAMEYVDGQDLDNIGRTTPERAAEIVSAIADGVHFAHENGIVHRDLKPANILVDSDGQPKVTDFGLAKLLDDEAISLTAADQLMGTAPYMPPEQARGESKHVGPMADVYSLGAVLYFLLTGGPPFSGNSTLEVLKKVENDDPTSTRKTTKGIPVDLDTICLKCLEKDPAKRYQSAELLAEDLRCFLTGDSINASKLGPIGQATRYVRRRRSAQIAGLALVALFLFTGWKYWQYRQYAQPIVRHYSSLDSAFAVPVGAGPLNASQRENSNSFKVTQVGRIGPVKSITSINSAGVNTPNRTLSSFLEYETGDEIVEVAHVEFERNADGELVDVIAFNRIMEKLWSFHYTDPPNRGQYLGPDGYELARSDSGASYIEFKFDEQNRKIESRFYDRNQRPQANAKGVFGYSIAYDEVNNNRTITNLDQSGKQIQWKGIASTRRWLDQSNNLKRVEFLDESGNLTLGSEGYAAITYEYKNSQLVAQNYLNESNDRVHNPAGVSRTQYQYDVNVFKITEEYYDADDNLTNSTEGYAKVEFSSNKLGQILCESYFGPDRKPIVSSDGYSSLQFEYNSKGMNVKETVFDSQRKPSRNSNGIHRIDRAYDDDGNETKTSYFDLDGSPVTNEFGISRRVARFERKRPVSIQYFDIAGKRTNHKDGYSEKKQAFDSRGNVKKVEFFDELENPVLTADGYSIEELDYDELGNQIAHRLFDASGNATVHVRGWHKKTLKHDEFGNVIEVDYFNTTNQPAWFSGAEATINSDAYHGGFSSQRISYDGRGNVLDMMFLDERGEPVLNSDGYSVRKIEYDRYGNETHNAYFDTKGNPTFSKRNRAARVEAKYDRNGNLTEIAWFDTEGKPTRNGAGVAREQKKYNERNKLVEYRGFSTSGQPLGSIQENGSRDAPVLRFEYDNRGNRIKRMAFSGDGNPTRDHDGVHIKYSKYDHRGFQVEVQFLDQNKELIVNSVGIARKSISYDSQGNITEERYFGLDGTPVVDPNVNAATIKAEYNRNGNATSIAHFGNDGEPVLGFEGFHETRSVFDQWGRLAETRFFGIDSKPSLNRYGIAGFRHQYDSKGNETEIVRFGVHDELVEGNNKYAIQRKQYDDRGNLVAGKFFDRNDKPVKDNFGVASFVSKYNERGLQTHFCVFDEAGNPTVGKPYLFHCRESGYNERGDHVTDRYMGIDMKLKNNPDGIAQLNVHYDDNGNKEREEHLDQDGRSVTVRVRVNQVSSGSVAERIGVRVGDIVVSFDGQPVTDAANLVYLRDSIVESANVSIQREDKMVEMVWPRGRLGVNFDNVFGEQKDSGK